MFKRTLFRGANVSRVEAPMKNTVKVNAQALVAPGRFVVEGVFSSGAKTLLVGEASWWLIWCRYWCQMPFLRAFQASGEASLRLFVYLDAVLFENVHAFLAFRVAYLQYAED